MRLYTQNVGGILIYICEMSVGGSVFVGQSTFSPRHARDMCLKQGKPYHGLLKQQRNTALKVVH